MNVMSGYFYDFSITVNNERKTSKVVKVCDKLSSKPCPLTALSSFCLHVSVNPLMLQESLFSPWLHWQYSSLPFCPFPVSYSVMTWIYSYCQTLPIQKGRTCQMCRKVRRVFAALTVPLFCFLPRESFRWANLAGLRAFPGTTAWHAAVHASTVCVFTSLCVTLWCKTSFFMLWRFLLHMHWYLLWWWPSF